MAEETNATLTAENEAAVNTQTQTQTQGEQKEQTAKTYSEAELKAEADRRVTKALQTFKEKELPGIISASKSEGEKLAKLTADQKAELERKQAEEDLSRREAELAKKELKYEAHKTLLERGLPAALLHGLDYTNAGTCGESIDELEKAFRAAVEEGVNARLKTSVPAKGSGATQTSTEQLANIFGLNTAKEG